MPGRAKPDEEKRRIFIKTQDKWMDKAVEMYRTEQNNTLGEKKLGLRSVCKLMEEACWKEDKTKISLDKSSLTRRLNGVPSQAQSKASKGWLTEGEADAIINYATQMANESWPLSQRRILEHANEICFARYSSDFDGLGHNWVDRFTLKHRDRLKGSWSRPLDKIRAQAGNPVAKADYFVKLKSTIDGEEEEEPIPDELIYAADETGVQEGIGLKERVYGDPTKNFQHQQRSGGRENITVIVTICADGTSLPPAVIFKGENFQTSWRQNNPLQASLGHSTKGYTDGEIGVAWIKNFDQKTKDKANGRRRLLIVDGHNSHYTRAFLEYAREHKIRVLCYPSHSTHLYQGLDVVIFSVLKRSWSKYRDGFERETGKKVSKQNFLAVYAKAHLEALSKDNIIAAFKKTGVVPFNPDVITETMLAPSRTSSTQSGLPTPLTSPVRVMSDLIDRIVARQASTPTSDIEMDDTTHDSDGESNAEDNRGLLTPTRVALSELGSTSLSHLVSRSAPRSSSKFPLFPPSMISPFKLYNQELLEIEPKTENEKLLQNALREAEDRDRRRKTAMVNMQGVTVLQNMYVKKNNMHLQGHEDEQKRKRQKNRMFGDGMAKLLDDDVFFNKVVELDEAAKKKAEEKEERQIAREAHAEALAAWKKLEEERKERNAEIRKAYLDAMKEWEVECDTAKLEKRRVRWTKPKQGKLEKGIPRPKKPEMGGSDGEDEPDADQETEHDDDD